MHSLVQQINEDLDFFGYLYILFKIKEEKTVKEEEK